MADSTNGQASKPSIFGKMFSIIKNVTDMAMDLQTDEGLSDNDDNNAADEDDEPPMLDFLTKYDVGSSIHNDLTADAVTKITDAEVNLLDLSGPTQDLLDPDLLALDTNIGDLLIDDLVVADSTTDPENLTPVDNQEAATDCAADIAQMGGLESSGAARRGFISSGIAQTFHTRVGPNYKANKQKAPSASALLELMSVDFVRTPCRVPDVGRFLNIPEEWSADIDTHHPGIPPLFIVQAQIPDKWPTTVFVETTDGPCYSFILVYRVTQETAEAMRDLNSACPAVQLFAQYCLENYQAYQESTTTNGTSTSANANSSDSGDSNRGGGGGGATNSVTDGQQVQVGDNGNNANFAVTGENWVARSKVFVRCDNIHELTQLPKFLHAYNAKPALIRESGTLVRGKGYLELDVNIKKFGLLANKTLPILLARLHLMQLSIAICIEGREEEEMPEGILGCVGVHNLSARPSHVPMWFVKKK